MARSAAKLLDRRDTKAELDARVGQASASRAHETLGVIGADHPAGLPGEQPMRKPPASIKPSMASIR